jgi:hypothetical protein
MLQVLTTPVLHAKSLHDKIYAGNMEDVFWLYAKNILSYNVKIFFRDLDFFRGIQGLHASRLGNSATGLQILISAGIMQR